MVIMTIGFIIASFSHVIVLEWVAMLITVCGAGLSYVFIVTICSSLVGEDDQGWIMGITTSVIAIAWTITALIIGWLDTVSLYVPIIISFIVGLLGILLLILFNLFNKK